MNGILRQTVIRIVSMLIGILTALLEQNTVTKNEFNTDMEACMTFSINEQLKIYYNLINE